jgi:hypothetical protein
MAQLALGAVGAVVGSFVGMPQIGFAVGSAIGGAFFAPTQKAQGPRLSDLKAPAATYGSTIPFIEGHPRYGGVWIWQSEKREIAATESQGGKGGPKVENTTFTYEMDVMILLTEGPFAGVRRCWSNGKLVWTAADDADGDSLEASAETFAWRELRVMKGLPDQLPDPTYEAAVGVGNAPAMRDRGCLFIEGLNLGQSGQPPVLTWEVCSQTTEANEADIVLDVPFDTGTQDEAPNPIVPTAASSGSITIISDEAIFDIVDNEGPSLIYSASKLTPDPARRLTIEAYIDPVHVRGSGTGDNYRFFIYRALGGGGEVAFGFRVVEGTTHLLTSVSDGGSTVVADHGPPTSSRFAFVVEGGICYLLSGSSVINGAVAVAYQHIELGSTGARTDSAVTAFSVDKLKAYYGDAPVDVTTLTLEDIPLDEVVTRQCIRGGLTEDQINVVSLIGLYVRAMAVTQVTSPRTVIESLMAAYFFEAVEDEKLTFVRRGGPVALTIPFDDLGASADSSTGEPLPLTSGNDTEIPQQVTVKFSRVENDYQDGAESSDRIQVGGTGAEVLELPLGLSSLEAKQIADKRVTDYGAGKIRVGPFNLDRSYAALQPTDIVMLHDETGSSYRVRLLKRTDADGLLTFEGVLDDATVMNSNAVTSGGYNSSTLVRKLSDTEQVLLDVPILRDADNDQGFYAAVKRADDGYWPGAAIYASPDAVSYTRMADFYDEAVFGTCSTVLGDWTGARVFDEANTLTVNVGGGALYSSTRLVMLNSQAVNACAIGRDGRWEICQFRDAELQSPGVYVLSGFLRGSRGTEWATIDHESSEKFVLLSTSGTRRLLVNTSQIGVERFYKSVTFNKSISAVVPEAFTDNAVGMKPFSPFDVRGAHDVVTGDIELTWQRRTRLSTRVIGPLGISVPLGEQSEHYSIDVFSNNTYTTVVRTLSSDATSVVYSAAQQTADFGSTQAIIYVKVYQVSEVVGRGYEIKAAA